MRPCIHVVIGRQNNVILTTLKQPNTVMLVSYAIFLHDSRHRFEINTVPSIALLTCDVS